MLRNLGRLIWSQPREMQVFNYPKAMLYQVRTSDGNILLKYCKKTETWTVDKERLGDLHKLFKEDCNTDLSLPTLTPLLPSERPYSIGLCPC
jgi:hypothetical protein